MASESKPVSGNSTFVASTAVSQFNSSASVSSASVGIMSTGRTVTVETNSSKSTGFCACLTKIKNFFCEIFRCIFCCSRSNSAATSKIKPSANATATKPAAPSSDSTESASKQDPALSVVTSTPSAKDPVSNSEPAPTQASEPAPTQASSADSTEPALKQDSAANALIPSVTADGSPVKTDGASAHSVGTLKVVSQAKAQQEKEKLSTIDNGLLMLFNGGVNRF